MPLPDAHLAEQLDALQHLETELSARDYDETAPGALDRRHFLFLSLVSAAATSFGAASALGAQGRSANGLLLAGQQQQPTPVPLGNGEAPALQFQPYPAGTGALMQRLARERGAAAFERTPFDVPAWSGAVPSSPDDIAFLPAHRLSALIRERRISVVQLTDIYLARLKRLDPALLCAVTIMESQARAAALRADAELAAGTYRGPLHGLPYGLKDLFSTRGVPTTWGAADFRDRVIDEDAEIVVRLREAGAILIAKLSTGLFAQNDWWFRGRTNNPWNLSQGSSGSSAGPASATAAGCVAFSIGTETQGSIVSPAVRCGVSALRPTFGRVSRHGGMVLAWSHDRAGPICRTIEDCAMVFQAIHGVDEKDPSTVTTPFQFDRSLDLARLRIGVDPAAPAELVAGLRALGAVPRTIGARPTVPGLGGGLGVEGSAAFDSYVQRKAKEMGIDLAKLPPRSPPTPGAPPAAAAAAPANPMAPADWNPRFVNGRTVTAMDFIQAQRRRYLLVSQWGEFMKDLDMFVAAPFADVGANAQTGHPCVVVPYKFAVPAAGGPGGRAPAAPTQPPPPAEPPLAPQPICGTIVGALYQDDLILGVAHRFQVQEGDTYLRRPSL
ncbi:MAG: amidase [Gemmatimonadaceae bacterium]|nr:amidase [Gemmatimonadaceae bacterium]